MSKKKWNGVFAFHTIEHRARFTAFIFFGRERDIKAPGSLQLSIQTVVSVPTAAVGDCIGSIRGPLVA